MVLCYPFPLCHQTKERHTMIQPNEPVIQALRQDIVELKALVKEIQENLETMNRSVQGAFQATTKTTGLSLKFLDSRLDDLEERVLRIEGSPNVDTTSGATP